MLAVYMCVVYVYVHLSIYIYIYIYDSVINIFFQWNEIVNIQLTFNIENNINPELSLCVVQIDYIIWNEATLNKTSYSIPRETNLWCDILLSVSVLFIRLLVLLNPSLAEIIHLSPAYSLA